MTQLRQVLLAVVALAALLLVVSPPAVVHGFYVPAVAPESYAKGESVVINVNSLTSNTEIISYPFYSVKTCAPSKENIKKFKKRENIGELLRGDQIEPSLYLAAMMKDVKCRKVCKKPVQYGTKDKDRLAKLIEAEYKGNMVLDNLPVAQEVSNNRNQPHLSTGYPLGIPKKYLNAMKRSGAKKNAKSIINNHLEFVVGYHRPEVQPRADAETFRIVYFYVVPRSIDWDDDAKSSDSLKCSVPAKKETKPLYVGSDEVLFTYSVTWKEEPDIVWATRWDVYLRGGENDGRVHWTSIINTMLILAFLSAVVAVIMIRALHKDFIRYNTREEKEEAAMETGWKLVHADVFRPPDGAFALIVQVASGVQLCCMVCATLVMACCGILSPSFRGGLILVALLLFALFGSAAGYTAAKFLKFCDLQSWSRIFGVGLFYPGIIFSVFIGLDFITWGNQGTKAVPFSAISLLVGLWLLGSVTTTLLGASRGYQEESIKVPCKTNAVKRLIPVQPWYLRSEVVVPLCGILPFFAAFVELIFIFSSLWQGRVYYVFGFLAVVFVIVCTCSAEIAIVMTYFTLISEDYRWWHRAYYMTASSGVHLFLYCFYYYATVLDIKQTSSTILYFGYSFMISVSFGLVTGAVGFLGTFAFVRKIYGSIKLD